MSRPFRIYLVLTATLLIVDQLTKWWARVAGEGVEGRSLHPLWSGVFELKLVYNEGIAFGMLPGKGVLLAPVAIVIALGTLWYSYRHPREPMLTHGAMALLAAGAIGNLIDRVTMGRVTDMFWFRLIDFPVFNIADVCITVAAGLLVISWAREAMGGPQRSPAGETPADS